MNDDSPQSTRSPTEFLIHHADGMIHYRLHSLKGWTMNSRGFSNPWNEGGPFSSHQPERLNLVNGNVQSFRLFRACESSTPEAWKPPANKEVQPFRLVNTFRVLCGEQVINSVSLCSIIKNLRHRRNLRMKNIKLCGTPCTQWWTSNKLRVSVFYNKESASSA